MDTEKINSYLGSLGDLNNSMRAFDSCQNVNLAAAAVDTLDQGGLAGLAAELATPDTPQRFGPLLYSLRQIYGQLAETRAMVDVPRLLDWADAVLVRIGREVNQPEQPAAEASTATAGAPAIPEGAKEFVIFESIARPGYRVACYRMGIGNELFGLDGKPRVAPDPTKWEVVAFTKLPEGLDLIAPAALALPGDEGLPDWNAAPVAAAASEGEATAIKIEGHAPVLEFASWRRDGK
jgi:hypothetical protein